MTRQLVYVAHPVGGDVQGNIARAKLWLAWLRRAEPGVAFIAPWIASIDAGEDDDDPAQRERGLLDAEACAARCDGLVMCGPRVSNGMLREANALGGEFTRALPWVADLTRFKLYEPPVAHDVVDDLIRAEFAARRRS